MIVIPDEVLGWREAGEDILRAGETRELRVFTREDSKRAQEHLETLKDLDLKDLKRNMEWIALPSLLMVMIIVTILFSLDLGQFAFGLFIIYGALVFAMAFSDDSNRHKRLRKRRLAWINFVCESAHRIPDGLPFEVIRSDNDLLIEKLLKVSAIEDQLLRDDYVSPLTTGEEAREELLSARRELMREISIFLAPSKRDSDDSVVSSPESHNSLPTEEGEDS